MRKIRMLVGAVSLAFCAIAAAAAQAGNPTIVILVRHAEKAAAPAADPPLTAAGETRANDLSDAVRDAGVRAIITTQYLRTKATAQPTAAASGIVPEVLAANSPTHVQDVVAAIRRHAGATVLVVGHSNTVPAIVAALGAKQPAPICDPEYDNIYIVTLTTEGKAGVVRARYGVRTPVDTSCAAMMK